MRQRIIAVTFTAVLITIGICNIPWSSQHPAPTKSRPAKAAVWVPATPPKTAVSPPGVTAPPTTSVTVPPPTTTTTAAPQAIVNVASPLTDLNDAWTKVAICEEGGWVGASGPNYPDSLGITAANWYANGGGSDTSPSAQIAVAERLRASIGIAIPDQNGCGAW